MIKFIFFYSPVFYYITVSHSIYYIYSLYSLMNPYTYYPISPSPPSYFFYYPPPIILFFYIIIILIIYHPLTLSTISYSHIEAHLLLYYSFDLYTIFQLSSSSSSLYIP